MNKCSKSLIVDRDKGMTKVSFQPNYDECNYNMQQKMTNFKFSTEICYV